MTTFTSKGVFLLAYEGGLKDKNDKELAEYIENTLPKRELFYNKANIIINADPLSTEEGALGTAKRVLEMI